MDEKSLEEKLHTPQLANEGVATAYVVLPIGKFDHELKSILKSIVTRSKSRYGPTAYDIVMSLGQSDLMAHITLGDFRHVRGLRDPQGSNALVFNWIFSVPYEKERVKEKLGIRFVLHVRVNRPLYSESAVPMERMLVAHLRRLLDHANCKAEIHAGVGWADYVIIGSFAPEDFDLFVRLIVDVHESKIVDPADPNVSRGVFRRTMTVLGYSRASGDFPFKKPDMAVKESAPPKLPQSVTPVMFVRSNPGHLAEVTELFKTQFAPGTESVQVKLIDGKSDCVVMFQRSPNDEEAEEFSHFLRRHLVLAEPSGADKHVQKIETHLVFQDAVITTADDMKRRTVNRESGGLNELPRAQCECTAEIQTQVRNMRTRGVPQELRNALENVRHLFSSLLLDDLNCCDAGQAVVAALSGLERVMKELLDEQYRQLRQLQATGRGAANELKFRHDQIIDSHELIRRWHLSCERLLRQRTIGSFEELHLQSDRAVVYRGSVQKFLFLADGLMNDFAATIAKGGLRLRFASMYDAIGRIQTLRGTGLVHVPVRHLFTLPHVLPDLWHEVGVHLFYYQSFEKVRTWRSDRDVRDYEDLGDHFGDLVVLDHGFRGRLDRFVRSLTCSWMDSAAYRTIPRPLLENMLVRDVLARICIALVVHDLRSAGHTAAIKALGANARYSEFVRLVSRSINWISNEIVAVFRLPVTAPPFDTLVVTEDCRNRAIKRATRQLAKFGIPLLENYEKFVNPSAPAKGSHDDFIAGYDGVLQEFDAKSDMNLLFGDLYWFMEQHRSEPNRSANMFQKIAGLTRSAVLEYHHRQARRM